MNKNIPEIRFNGYDDEWVQRKLSDEFGQFIVPMRDKPKSFCGNIPWTRIEDIEGKYLNDSLSGQYVTEETVKQMNLKVIPKDSLIVSSSATFGVVAVITQDLITNQTFIGLVPNDKETLDYWYPFFYSDEARKYMRLESAGSTIFYIARESFENMPIKVASKDEMIKIGEYFDDLDHLITLHQQKYDKLVTTKKSMLDKMFPKKGCNIPEIRFAGFDESWKEIELGEVFKEYSEKNHAELPVLMIIQGGGTIKRDEADRNLSYDKSNLSNYKMVNEGDFIVHLRSFEGGLEMATNTGLISPAYHTLHGEDTDSRFYYYYFRSRKFIDIDLKPHVYGIRDGRSIDVEGMKTIKIPYTTYEEQKVIGDFIEKIDTLITLQQQELEKLKNIKKALLGKMFV